MVRRKEVGVSAFKAAKVQGRSSETHRGRGEEARLERKGEGRRSSSTGKERRGAKKQLDWKGEGRPRLSNRTT